MKDRLGNGNVHSDFEQDFLKLVKKSDQPPPSARRLRSDGPVLEATTESFTIYGHTLTHTDTHSVGIVDMAKISYINTVLEDLESRFDGFNSVTASFDCIFKVLEVSEDQLRELARPISEAYKISLSDLVDQLKLWRTVAKVKKLKFANFAAMAKFILTRTSEEALKHVHFLVSVILVLPFVTADCERLFSKLGYIKRKDRNRLGGILNDLLHIYDMKPSEKESIDILELARQLAGRWDYDKVDKTPYSEA